MLHHERSLFCLPGEICQVEIYPRGKKAKRKAVSHCFQLRSRFSFFSFSFFWPCQRAPEKRIGKREIRLPPCGNYQRKTCAGRMRQYFEPVRVFALILLEPLFTEWIEWYVRWGESLVAQLTGDLLLIFRICGLQSIRGLWCAVRSAL